jgi:hypothetical protein
MLVLLLESDSSGVWLGDKYRFSPDHQVQQSRSSGSSSQQQGKKMHRQSDPNFVDWLGMLEG